MKIISLYNPFNFLAILYPTSLANLVVEVESRNSHQILFSGSWFCTLYQGTNWWFLIWPPGIVNIVNGSYWHLFCCHCILSCLPYLNKIMCMNSTDSRGPVGRSIVPWSTPVTVEYKDVNRFHFHKPIPAHNTLARAFLLCLCINRCTCLCMRPANERRRYNVTRSHIGWAHSQNGPCPANGFYSLKLLHSLNQYIFQIWWGSIYIFSPFQLNVIGWPDCSLEL